MSQDTDALIKELRLPCAGNGLRLAAADALEAAEAEVERLREAVTSPIMEPLAEFLCDMAEAGVDPEALEKAIERTEAAEARLSAALASIEAVRPTVELVVCMAAHGVWSGRPGDIEVAKAALAALPQPEGDDA